MEWYLRYLACNQSTQGTFLWDTTFQKHLRSPTVLQAEMLQISTPPSSRGRQQRFQATVGIQPSFHREWRNVLSSLEITTDRRRITAIQWRNDAKRMDRTSWHQPASATNRRYQPSSIFQTLVRRVWHRDRESCLEVSGRPKESYRTMTWTTMCSDLVEHNVT